MASVLIRHVDEALHARLKASAAAHRRSLEEETRELLRAAVARQKAPPREIWRHWPGAFLDRQTVPTSIFRRAV